MASTGPLLAAMAAELRAEQARQKLTGRQLAELTGIPHNTQQRYLSGTSVASPDDLEAIAQALGTDLFAVHAIVAQNQARNAGRDETATVPHPRRRATDITQDSPGSTGQYAEAALACQEHSAHDLLLAIR